MPAKEIKELRYTGRLEEALLLATKEWNADPNNVWAKRNIAWVYFDYLKQNDSAVHFATFVSLLEELIKLQLPEDNAILLEQLSWKIGLMALSLAKISPIEIDKCGRLLELAQMLPLPKRTEGYIFLFRCLHKVFEKTDHYLVFADWWDFNNFTASDFEKEAMPRFGLSSGAPVMAIAEQAYICYAKHLLRKRNEFDKDKIINFVSELSEIVEHHPNFEYIPYYKGKLLIALDGKNNTREHFLPFAKSNRSCFWVWELLAETVSNQAKNVLSCYCKALLCIAPETRLIKIRLKLTYLLINKRRYSTAKTEIETLVTILENNNINIPEIITFWQLHEWYRDAASEESNVHLYHQYAPFADDLLFDDIREEVVIVEFVNSKKKLLRFIANELKYGFFKYDRFLKDVKIGDTLKVRFQGGSKAGIYQVYTVRGTNDEKFKRQYIKNVKGRVSNPYNESIGFINDVLIPASLMSKQQLTDGTEVKGRAIKTYNHEQQCWVWRLFDLHSIYYVSPFPIEDYF